MERRPFLAILLAACLSFMTIESSSAAETLRLTGSGASFPFPLYSAWFKDFSRKNKNVHIDYQAKGSGAGIQDLINRTVDFAASDAAMTAEQRARVEGGVVLLPMTAGEIVLSYNLPGDPKRLKLPRDVYPEIFLGKITQWTDPRIANANPTVKLPDLPVTVVRRADSSGTTFVFTNHLAAISPAFKQGPGSGMTVNWPSSDKFVAAPKNDGVAAVIKQTPGAIGYIEYAYAKGAKINMAELQNKAGEFVAPGPESGKASLAQIKLPPDLIAWEFDPEGEDSYPIVSLTWMLFYKKNNSPKEAEALRKMIEYGLTEGQKMSTQLGYIPLSPNIVEADRTAAKEIQ